jgi:hypothetical protein
VVAQFNYKLYVQQGAKALELCWTGTNAGDTCSGWHVPTTQSGTQLQTHRTQGSRHYTAGGFQLSILIWAWAHIHPDTGNVCLALCLTCVVQVP